MQGHVPTMTSTHFCPNFTSRALDRQNEDGLVGMSPIAACFYAVNTLTMIYTSRTVRGCNAHIVEPCRSHHVRPIRRKR